MFSHHYYPLGLFSSQYYSNPKERKTVSVLGSLKHLPQNANNISKTLQWLLIVLVIKSQILCMAFEAFYNLVLPSFMNPSSPEVCASVDIVISFPNVLLLLYCSCYLENPPHPHSTSFQLLRKSYIPFKA